MKLTEKIAEEVAAKVCCPDGCIAKSRPEKCQAYMFYEPKIVEETLKHVGWQEKGEH